MTPPALRLFGRPTLAAPGGSVAFEAERRFQLLALLAAAGGEWVARDRAAALFWPDRGNSEARRNLRTVVFRARALPGADLLEATEHALRWPVASDLQDFDAALAAGRNADAIALYRPPLMAGLDDDDNPAFADWLAEQRARVAAAWQAAALAQLQALAAPADIAALATRLLETDPLDETALAARIGAELALGRRAQAHKLYDAYAERLAGELGVEPSRQLRALVEQTSLPPTAAAPIAAAGNDFVGRRLEQSEFQALLARPECRLLTVLGPGGIGKSRLAREALVRCAPLFPGGTLWVELQDLVDRASVVVRLAQRLGVEIDDRADPVRPLLRGLPAERSLLVLDNAEHLPELPALLNAIVDGHPAVCLLVTSRSRLHGPHEWLLPLAGLAVPDADSRDVDAAAAFDAVRLFERRAQAAQRGFALARHLPAVIDIVEAVGGLPLAIELAAGWVRLMPPDEIARDLARSFDLLERDPAAASAPARPEHASVRAVLDRSAALLAPAERAALEAVSVFHGGFTRAAAQAVAAVSLPLLSSLVDKSLLAVDDGGRFGAHPLVLAHAAERLALDAEREAQLRRRHAEHYAGFMAGLAPLTRGDLKRLLREIRAEYANVRGAWEHALRLRRADLVGRIVRALWVFYEASGQLREGTAQIRPALALPRHDAESAWALARVRHGLSMLQHRHGDQEEALAIAEAGIALGPGCGDFEAWIGCQLNAGSCLWTMGRVDAAHERFGAALAAAREQGDRHCTAWALGNLAVSHGDRGEAAAAVACGLEALATDRELGNQYQIAVHLINLGVQYTSTGEHALALRYTEEALQHALAHDIDGFAIHARGNLAWLLQRMQRLDDARGHAEVVLERAAAIGHPGVEVGMLTLLARIDIDAARHAQAQRSLRRAVRLAQDHGLHVDLMRAARVWAQLLAAAGSPLRAARILQTVLGRPETPPGDAQACRDALAALPLDDARRADAAAAAPALADVLAALDGPLPPPETAEKRPPP